MPSMMTSPWCSEDRWSGNATRFIRMLYPIQAAVLKVRSWLTSVEAPLEAGDSVSETSSQALPGSICMDCEYVVGVTSQVSESRDRHVSKPIKSPSPL